METKEFIILRLKLIEHELDELRAIALEHGDDELAEGLKNASDAVYAAW